MCNLKEHLKLVSGHLYYYIIVVSVLRLSYVMAAVEKVEKECEDETLQTAFKKLRVDAERFAKLGFCF